MRIQLIHFLVKGVHLCAMLHDIQKVLPLVAVEELPGGPSWLSGFMNIQGRGVPLIDLALRAGMRRHKKFSLWTPVLLCATGEDMFHSEAGLIVDSITGLLQCDSDDLEMHTDASRKNPAILATLTQGDTVSFLIDMKYFLGVHPIEGEMTHESPEKG